MEQTIQIEGMSCDHCVKAVRKALEGIPGVKVLNVRVGSARVSHDATRQINKSISAALIKAGYSLKH